MKESKNKKALETALKKVAFRGGSVEASSLNRGRAKITVTCDQGHTFTALASSIADNDYWCPDCEKGAWLQRFQALASAKGGACLSANYTNQLTRLRFRCAFGHEWDALPNNVWDKDSWCPSCAGNAPLTIDQFHTYATQRGGRCLSSHYIDSKTPLEFECSSGHGFYLQPRVITWQGSWCSDCQRASLDDVHEYCQARSGRCLTTEYINNYTPLLIECDQGHRWFSARKHILDGRWCQACYLDWRSTDRNEA